MTSLSSCQHLAAGQGVVEHVAPLLRERFALQQVQHAHDAVHRGADLVAHVGQEGRLRLGGGLGGLLRLDEGDLLSLALVEVLDQAHGLQPAAALAHLQMVRDAHPAGLPVGPDDPRLEGPRPLGAGMQRAEGFAHVVQVVGVEAREAQLGGLFVGGVLALAGDLRELRRGPEGLRYVVDLVDPGLGRLERDGQALGARMRLLPGLLHLQLAAAGHVAGLGQLGDVLGDAAQGEQAVRPRLGAEGGAPGGPAAADLHAMLQRGALAGDHRAGHQFLGRFAVGRMHDLVELLR